MQPLLLPGLCGKIQPFLDSGSGVIIKLSSFGHIFPYSKKFGVSLNCPCKQLLIQVPFFSFTSNPSSSTLENFIPFYPGCRLLPSVPRALTSIMDGERCQFVFECQSFDDHPALFLVIAFLSTARLFFTLDLDLLGEGEEEKETVTRISCLDTDGVIRFRKFSLYQSSSMRRYCSHSSVIDQASLPIPIPSFPSPQVNFSPVTWSRQFSSISRCKFSGVLHPQMGSELPEEQN